MTEQKPYASIEVDAGKLRAAFKASQVAISTQETRYYLNGSFIQTSDTKWCGVTITSTDGHRLVSSDVTADAISGAGSCIVPRPDVSRLVKWLYKRTGNVSVAIHGARFEVSHGADAFTSQIIDGSFPDWKRVLPGKHADLSNVVVSRKFLADALKQLLSVHAKRGIFEVDGRFYKDEHSQVVRVTYLEGKLKLSRRLDVIQYSRTLSHRMITRGKRKGEVETKEHFKEMARDGSDYVREVVCSPRGAKVGFHIGFNIHYLAELIGTQGEFVTLQTQYGGPCNINCEDGATRVLMPCRI